MTRWLPLALTMTFSAAAVAIALAVVTPTFRRIVDVRRETIAAHEQFERRYRGGLARNRAFRDLTALQTTIAALTERIPTERGALAFVQSVERVARAHQVEERIAVDWTPTRADAAQRIARTPMTIELAGPYPALVAALRDLERLSLPLAATHLTVTIQPSADAGTPSPIARVRLLTQSDALWRR